MVIKCLGRGGAERLMVEMARAGDRGAFHYEAAYVLEDSDAMVPALAATGTPVHALGARSHWDLRWLGALRRLLDGTGFDIVHFHLPYTAALGRLVVRSIPRDRRPKVVYTEHSVWGETAWPVRALNRSLVGSDDAIIAVSENGRRALPAVVRARCEVVVHGLERTAARARSTELRDVRTRVRRELSVGPADALVMTVANLRPEKGYDVFLRAARLVLDVDCGRRVHFVSVGWGPHRAVIEDDCRSLGLEGRVRFLGERLDVPELLAGADIFAVASRYEGLPVALMEAMMAGVAIVATAVGDIPSLLRPGVDGLVVPPGRPDALAEGISRLVWDRELRARLAGSARVRSQLFDSAAAAKRVEGIYAEIAGGSR